MINNLLTETKKFIDSEEYYASMQSISHYYQLSEDREGMLIGRINAFLIGDLKEENLIGELISELEITEAKAKNIEERVKKEIIIPFKQKLVSLLNKTEVNNSLKSSPTTIQSPQKITQPRPPESLTKASILSEIENPPRTVIKRYVIEHEPIADPAHIIDDTIDERPKLEEHYKD